jgi:outer membrane protein OmpA-like peptidoglycan-associated protein
MSDDYTPKEEGSVWTSYADLFTNVAVIFLVMFVFALLKSGISKLENVQLHRQHEQEMQAKVSPAEVARSEEKVKKIESSIDEMQKVQMLVDEKMREIQGFAKTMETNKSVLKEVIEEQKKKDSMLNVAGERLKMKERLISELEAKSEALNENIQRLSNEKNQLMSKVTERESLSREEQKRINVLQQELARYSLSRTNMQKELVAVQASALKGRVTLEALEKQNHELTSKIKASEVASENLATTRDLLKGEIRDLTVAKSRMEQSIGALKEKLQSEAKSNESLLGRLTRSETDRDAMKSELARLNQSLESRLNEVDQLKALYSKAMNQAGNMENRLTSTQDQLKNLARSLQEMKGRLRSGVADSLKKKFKAQAMNVQVDPNTGTITLLISDHLLFKNNSYDLSDRAQKALSKIAPIYAEVIFGDPYVAGKVESIEITGHASPSYKRTYVDPRADAPDAYAHNMRLSAQRAASIANYMVGSKIGVFPHKHRLKETLFAIGRSYVSPVSVPKAEEAGPVRRLASVGGACGPYDCALSQRVEIGFRLKEDMKAIEKLINSAGVK